MVMRVCKYASMQPIWVDGLKVFPFYVAIVRKAQAGGILNMLLKDIVWF